MELTAQFWLDGKGNVGIHEIFQNNNQLILYNTKRLPIGFRSKWPFQS